MAGLFLSAGSAKINDFNSTRIKPCKRPIAVLVYFRDWMSVGLTVCIILSFCFRVISTDCYRVMGDSWNSDFPRKKSASSTSSQRKYQSKCSFPAMHFLDLLPELIYSCSVFPNVVHFPHLCYLSRSMEECKDRQHPLL